MGVATAEAGRYRRIADELRRRIEARRYASGELPSTGQLAREFGTSLKTVQRALVELDRAGLTTGRPGRPRFIVAETDQGARTRYEQVAAGLRRDIGSGALPPGGRVPPEPALVESYGVSRATVREALALMERAGEIVKKAGRRYVAGSGAASDLAYERVAQELRKAIKSGRLRPEARLPGEHELAVRHSVSRPTVREGLARLQAEGLVHAVPRRGWFVTVATKRRQDR